MDYSPWSSKILINQNWMNKFMQVGMMSHACTPILVGLASLVLEILLLSKRAKFPFWTMDIVHGGQKLELAQKIMQVEVDDVFMCIKFYFSL